MRTLKKTQMFHPVVPKTWVMALGLLVMICVGAGVWAKPTPSQPLRMLIPILGTSLDRHRSPMGLVSNIVIDLFKRQDHGGLRIQFHTEPGQFSLLARQATHEAITRAWQTANLPTDSWTIQLTFPYEGLTVYGKSLSAMVALSVVAMAKGETLLEGRILTGTITDQGQIGTVGGLHLKIQAAHREHFQRVFIPSTYDVRDGDWHTPFLMQVSPVSTVEEAYLGLTGFQIRLRP